VYELSLHAPDEAESVPESVIDVVEGRLLRLSDSARRVANLIAVAGRVELPVLVEASSGHNRDLGDALGQLIRSELVQELDGGLPAYQFAHALIRDAVTSALPSFERFSLHEALARALEDVHETDRRHVLAELARHFAAAAPVCGWQKAAYYGRRAAGQARRTAAYGEAIALIQASLEVTPAGTEERALLLIDAVDLLERCGRNPEAIELAEEADDVATELNDLSLRASASIELERAAHLANASLERSIPRLRQVLEDGALLKPELSSQVTASLGRACWLTGTDGGPELIARGLDEARDLGDPASISHALEMACVAERDPQEALSLARELEQVTSGLGKIFQSMWAMTRQTDALLTLGRLAEAEQVLDRLRQSADRYRFTSYRYLSLVFSHSLALAAAAFDLAEEAAEAANTAEEAEFAGLDASGAYGLEMFMVRRAQGRLEEMRPVLQLLARNGGVGGVWRPGLVLAYAELGMREEAVAGFDSLVADECAACPRDTLWPLTLLFLADTCVLLERADAASLLLAELEPFGGLTFRAGYTTNGGPADRCRAALAELDGRQTEADVLIAAAHDLARTSASPLWLALTESTWAWMCFRRGDGEGTRTHDTAARLLAEQHGIGSIRAAPATSIAAAYPDELSAREVEVLAELALGHSNRRIAERLHISPNTAANHVRAILRKTASANRTEAASYAYRHGLAPDGPS
jgi:DNA-binding CsgD family transcriptional regulator/tetratricopeptide (TPR) repeat protein